MEGQSAKVKMFEKQVCGKIISKGRKIVIKFSFMTKNQAKLMIKQHF